MIDFSSAPLGGRIEGIKYALNLLNEQKSTNVFIIETGTTRGSLGGGSTADGWATPMFGWYCSKYGGQLWTVDLEKQAIEECKNITSQYAEHIKYFVDQSTNVLSQANNHIDLLYLDSGNSPDLALEELKAAEKNISKNTILYIDDTSVKKKRPGGVCKGILVYNYLFKKGWDVIFDNGDQIIMRKGPHSDRSLVKKLIADAKTKFIYNRVIRKNAI